MDITNIPLIAAGTGLVGLVVAFMLYMRVNSVKIDNKVVADITEEIQDGAMAFLKAEYRILGIFVAAVGVLLFVLNDVELSLIHISEPTRLR